MEAIRRTRFVLAAAAMLACNSLGATDSRQSSGLDAFLKRKEVEQERRYQALAGLGRASNYASVLKCVEQAKLEWPSGPRGATARQKAALATTFRHGMAGMILGTNTSYPRICSASAQRINQAAAKWIRGTAGEAEYVRFADTVVIARAVGGGRDAGFIDGFRSSLHFVVDEPIKGSLRKGSRFAVRLVSGPDGKGGRVLISTSPTTKPGQLYLVYASRGMYELGVAEGRKALPASDKTHPGHVPYGGILPVDAASKQADRSGRAVSLDQVRHLARAQRAEQ